MIVIKNLDEIIARICKEFNDLGFKKEPCDDGSIRFELNGNVAILHNAGYFVQIYMTFAHDWSEFVFPLKCTFSVVGNSLFYYGEIVDDD